MHVFPLMPKLETRMARDITWIGSIPKECDICGIAIANAFVDDMTREGPWANMCPDCHRLHGCGLGLGVGQRYEKKPDGKFHKTEGWPPTGNASI